MNAAPDATGASGLAGSFEHVIANVPSGLSAIQGPPGVWTRVCMCDTWMSALAKLFYGCCLIMVMYFVEDFRKCSELCIF